MRGIKKSPCVSFPVVTDASTKSLLGENLAQNLTYRSFKIVVSNILANTKAKVRQFEDVPSITCRAAVDYRFMIEKELSDGFHALRCQAKIQEFLSPTVDKQVHENMDRQMRVILR